MRVNYVQPLILSCMVLLTACNSSTSSETTTEEGSEVRQVNIVPVNSSLFSNASLQSINEVSCTLSDGSESTCYEITVSGFPADRNELGPFCPQYIDSTAEEAGKWFDDGVLHDLTGEFIANLSNFYNDNAWKLYNENTKAVFITNTQASCEGAARPDVAEEYQNHCVQCDINYYSEQAGEGVANTFLIPVTPQFSETTLSIERGNVGVSLNGITLAGAAPVEAILGAYTIAAFDDCVGHVNPFEGYHYHGANHGDGSCPGVEFETDGHSGAFAYAMDGFAIYGMMNINDEEDNDLDECRGHTDDTRGYHYHTAGPGENAFIGCFSGEIADIGNP